MEIWKDVVGYEGIYEVSNQGKVRTNENKTTFTEKHGVRKWKQRILKPDIRTDGTCSVVLWKEGNHKKLLVHRLVAFAFIPSVDGKKFVNHIDGSRLNNNVGNLEWCTVAENINHAFDNRLITSGIPLTLINQRTKQEHHFRSMNKAGEFLGRSHGYISALIKDNITSADGYDIMLVRGVD
jgi:hypothetical protein